MNVYDVAKAAGVSHQTVSNVLNNPSKVRPATAEKVLAAIRDLGYEVNSAARSLSSGRTRVIGFEIPSGPGSGNGFLDHFMLPFAAAAQAQDYRVMMFAAEHRGARDHQKLVKSNMVDGVVITDTRVNDSRVAALVETSVPFVAFGRTNVDIDYPWVDVDNAYAMRVAIERLCEAGHRNIVYIDTDADRFYLHERRTTAQALAESLGLSVEAIRVDESADGRDVLNDRLTQTNAATAVIAGSDLFAVTAVDVLKSLGRSISLEANPVIGFDDTALTAVTDPPITTIHQPVEEIIDRILDLLLSQLRGEPGASALLVPTLTVRSSA